jgi:putative flippase GtrA
MIPAITLRDIISNTFIKFCLIGVINTLINYSVFILFLLFLNINYIVAGIIGFITAALFAFFLNRRWSFRNTENNSRGFTIYLLLQICCFIIHLLVQYISINVFQVSQVYSPFPAIFITLFVNYNVCRNYVFSK